MINLSTPLAEPKTIEGRTVEASPRATTGDIEREREDAAARR